jgi:VanZ family protein
MAAVFLFSMAETSLLLWTLLLLFYLVYWNVLSSPDTVNEHNAHCKFEITIIS